MPSKSKAQHNLMAMVAHDPKAAKRVGISQSVGKDFMAADKGRKFSQGGEMATKKPSKAFVGEMEKMYPKGATVSPFKGKESKAEESKEKKQFPTKRGYAAMEAKKEGEKMPKFARGGGIETQGKTRGKVVTMACGGKAKRK